MSVRARLVGAESGLLGFGSHPVTSVRESLRCASFSLAWCPLVQLHLWRLKEQMKLQQQLYERLEAIAAPTQALQTIDLKEFIQLIEVTMMIENYYTPQQLDYLIQRREMLGDERLRQVEAEWQELIAQAQSAMQNGIDPAREAVQELARRSQELIQEFTGGDAGIERSLNQMYQQEGAEVASRGAMDSAVIEYMSRARAALNQSE